MLLQIILYQWFSATILKGLKGSFLILSLFRLGLQQVVFVVFPVHLVGSIGSRTATAGFDVQLDSFCGTTAQVRAPMTLRRSFGPSLRENMNRLCSQSYH